MAITTYTLGELIRKHDHTTCKRTLDEARRQRIQQYLSQQEDFLLDELNLTITDESGEEIW